MSTMLSACVARVHRAVAAASRPSRNDDMPGGLRGGCARSSRIAKAIASVLVFGALLCTSQPASAQFTQQGPKLTGSGASFLVIEPAQGNSVALSAVGNTAIVGGYGDDDETGAAWVFTRSGGVWSQQGGKLVGSGAVGSAEEGWSVALSADGNTALMGGPSDNTTTCCATPGAVWVFTRSGGVWSQQGSKLVGTGAVGNGNQGSSVALSADGNTAIVGGYGDNSNTGATWVFTRSGSTWTQQGSKLVGNTTVGAGNQGSSVAVSADGNTAIVGGPNDNSGLGAAWIFTRSGGVWTQQGSKLVGNSAVGSAHQGNSVALSADGNTAIVGGAGDHAGMGAVWVFTRSGGVWTQQGSKLVGTGAVGAAGQGTSAALSADGNTAIVGGNADNSNVGATWVFTQSGGVWTQQGSKLVGSGTVGAAAQGTSVALSANGHTAIMGGPGDNSEFGAAWVFASPNFNAAATHDFNGDGYSDIAWRDSGGDVAVWLMNGATIFSSAVVGAPATVWSIVGQRDFNGNGNGDILWRDTSGDLAMWFMNGTQVSSGVVVGTVPTVWSVVGTGDFNGDGYGDILWRDTSGDLAIWEMNGTSILNPTASYVGTVSPSTWTVVGTGDFNGDGYSDILWRDTSGNLAIWFMNGTQILSGVVVGNVPTTWSVVGTGDFNGDGRTDILWRDTSGDLAIWFMNGAQVFAGGFVATVPTVWSVAETGDFNGDGKSDILWTDTSGDLAIWFMNGGQILSGASVAAVPTVWSVQGLNAD